MKKTHLILLFILIILVSCTQYDSRQAPTKPINVGTKALEIQFLDNAPPNEVSQKEQFEVGVKLNNIGATSINRGFYSLNYPSQWLRIDDASGVFNVKGKDLVPPQGDVREAIFRAASKELASQQDVSDRLELTLTACFPYSTKAGIPVCIDADQTKKDSTKVCQVKPQSLGGGQGGPIAITKVEPRMQPTKYGDKIIPKFTLTLQNLGKGFVISEESTNVYCGGRTVDKENFGVINARVSLGDDELTCSTDQVRLTLDEANLVCELPTGIDKRLGTYSSFLDIELNYGYVQTATKGVRVRR